MIYMIQLHTFRALEKLIMYNAYSYKPSTSNAEYFVHVVNQQNDLINSTNVALRFDNKTVLYIIDRNLPSKYQTLITGLSRVKKSDVIMIDPSAKTINTLLPIYDAMVKTKPDIAIVLGGGTTGDLSGFACATYQRGIPRIYFPTTSLSMIDASVGGKNGIDHLRSKNSLSVRHYPQHAFMYLPFLDTLPDDEFHSGFAETVKLSIIANRSLLYELKNYIKDSKLSRYSLKLQSLIFNSAKTKALICEQPESNQITLLYGHAIGHAIESLSQSRMRHGDCVSIGMNLEGALACVLGIWNSNEWIMQKTILSSLNLPLDIPKKLSLESLVEGMNAYKKLTNDNEYLFILPETIGRIHGSPHTFLTAVKKTDMIKLLKKTLKWIKTI